MPANPAKRASARQTVPPCLKNLSVRRKIWFERDGEFVIGEGGFDLLNAVATTGSLTGAALVVGWSYRHAWGYLRRAEVALGARLTAPRPGKGRRRGIAITSVAVGMMEMGRNAGWRPSASSAPAE